MIETRLLQYFLAVAREQNFTRAAESLHIAQPTLSKQMMELEHQLGKPLFIRGKKRITLTEEGSYFRSRAQEMIDLMTKTESMFRNDEDPIAGDLWFGCEETPLMEKIADVFREMKAEYPNLKFHIFSGDANAILEQLDKGLLDMGLMFGMQDLDKYRQIPLDWKDRYGVLMSGDSPLASQSCISAEQLQTLPLILSQQIVNGQLLRDRMDWEEMNVAATYNLLQNATYLVKRGMGYAICPQNLVNTVGDRNLKLLPIVPEWDVDVYVTVKKYQVLSYGARRLLQELTGRMQF